MAMLFHWFPLCERWGKHANFQVRSRSDLLKADCRMLGLPVGRGGGRDQGAADPTIKDADLDGGRSGGATSSVRCSSSATTAGQWVTSEGGWQNDIAGT